VNGRCNRREQSGHRTLSLTLLCSAFCRCLLSSAFSIHFSIQHFFRPPNVALDEEEYPDKQQRTCCEIDRRGQRNSQAQALALRNDAYHARRASSTGEPSKRRQPALSTLTGSSSNGWRRAALTRRSGRLSLVIDRQTVFENLAVGPAGARGRLALRPPEGAGEFASLFVKDLSSSRPPLP
jgi:hypothetical protein